MPRTFPYQERSTVTLLKPITSPTTGPIQSLINNPSRLPYIVTSVDPPGDTISVTKYVPSVNPYRAQSEKQVGALQEEMRTTLEQVKDLEILFHNEILRQMKLTSYRSFILSN